MTPVALNGTFDHLKTSVQLPRLSGELPILPGRSHTRIPASPRPPRKRSWPVLMWVAAGTVAAAGAFSGTGTVFQEKSHAEAALSAAPLYTVTVSRPEPAATAQVVLPATFRPWQIATLHARVSGYLTAWHADLGTHVRAGELLAEIETPELDQEAVEGEALAREAVAAAVQAKAERQEAEADLKAAEAQLVRVKAEAELTRIQFARRKELLTQRAVSLEEHDTFQKQVEVRAAEVSAAESDVARRRANLETRAAIIEAREATANSRRANANRLTELQRFKRIVAPFEGVVTSRTAEVGMLVTAGKEQLFVVEDLSRIRVQMFVPQAYSVQASPGVQAEISLPESASESVRGTITRVAESVNATSRTMLAEIELDNAVSRFQPGSYARVTLTTLQDSSAWTIPTNTVSMRVEGPHVAIVNEHDQIELRRVQLGRDLGRQVVVVEGIRGDERLVVNPGDPLVNGLHVQVVGDAPGPLASR